MNMGADGIELLYTFGFIPDRPGLHVVPVFEESPDFYFVSIHCRYSTNSKKTKDVIGNAENSATDLSVINHE